MLTKNDLELEQTCFACPEQYDVKYNNKRIAYIRYRWGHFVCYPYKDNKIDWDTVIYEWSCSDEYAGILEDSEQYVIDNALNAVCSHYAGVL